MTSGVAIRVGHIDIIIDWLVVLSGCEAVKSLTKSLLVVLYTGCSAYRGMFFISYFSASHPLLMAAISQAVPAEGAVLSKKTTGFSFAR